MKVKKYSRRVDAVKCDSCGNIFMSGPTYDGLPNGLGFEDKDGNIINICKKCLIKLGQMTDDEKDKFFKELYKNKGE